MTDLKMCSFVALGLAAIVPLNSYGATVNIDFNIEQGANTYSGTAAAPDVGTFWNGVTDSFPGSGVNAINVTDLLTSTGGLSTVGFSATYRSEFAINPLNDNYLELSGGYSPLMEDYIYFRSSGSSVSDVNNPIISGLTPGNAYDLYFYGQGDQEGFNTGFRIGGDHRQTNYDGMLDGDGVLAEDIEYVKFPDVVADPAGNIVFDWINPTAAGPVDTSTGLADVFAPEARFGILNGIQVVGEFPVPEPSSAILVSLVLVGSLVRSRTNLRHYRV